MFLSNSNNNFQLSNQKIALNYHKTFYVKKPIEIMKIKEGQKLSGFEEEEIYHTTQNFKYDIDDYI